MSSIRLFILDSFARHGAMHGHQLRLQAEEEHVQLWTDITVGSLYGAIKRLAAEGLIEEIRVEREGNFPERQVYAITSAGLENLARLRRDQLAELAFKPDPFDLALTRLDPATLPELPAVIAGRMAAFRTRLKETRVLNERAQPYLSLTEKLALQHRERRLQSEIAWPEELTSVMAEIVADETARPVDADHPANVSVALSESPSLNATGTPSVA